MQEPAKARPIPADDTFRLLVDGVRDYAIFLLDANGNVASWNVGAERIKGYRAEEIVGQHFSKFYPAEDIAAGRPVRAASMISTRSKRSGSSPARRS